MANEHEQIFLRNMATLFKPNAKYADIAIHCRDDAEFRVHRAVVCSLSPVLAGDCEDDENDSILYERFDAEPMRCMLEYCYGQTYVVVGEEELFERVGKAGVEVSDEENEEGAGEGRDAVRLKSSSEGSSSTERQACAVKKAAGKNSGESAVVEEGAEENEDRRGGGAVGTNRERPDDKGHGQGIGVPDRGQEPSKTSCSQLDDDSNKYPVDTELTINKALLAHVEVHKIASHFQIPTLKRLATQRFEQVTSKCGIEIEGFVDAIQAVRALEKEGPGDMHHALYRCIAGNRAVIAEDKEFWKELANISDGGAFAAAMFRSAIRSETKRAERHAKEREQLQDTISEMEKDVRLVAASTAQLQEALRVRFIEFQAEAHPGLDWGVAPDGVWMLLLPVSIFVGCAVVIWANWSAK
ncbi:hypothetical protein BDY17DRAFT_328141 [Neohortaea acidophila]|uniref:BTB domain-containing protein n=1 Tax=Neohortaea acidophila TaxID=245834 RepID=A0A6A6PF49_9PEZI|nr:uncharacterized protein BDY17DRAFT_328141 [Neohortaea acidophila]KAF2478608.1 hypothetical protein BDY17DRAFT_328141 [Neohortaea acidophila]